MIHTQLTNVYVLQHSTPKRKWEIGRYLSERERERVRKKMNDSLEQIFYIYSPPTVNRDSFFSCFFLMIFAGNKIFKCVCISVKRDTESPYKTCEHKIKGEDESTKTTVFFCCDLKSSLQMMQNWKISHVKGRIFLKGR